MPVLRKRKGETKSQQYVRSAVTEMNKGGLHSGSEKGPKVTSRAQAIAIGLSQARDAGAKVPRKRSKKNGGK